MLGWHISVYRLKDYGESPATEQSPKGIRLAVWQTGLNGLNWISELVKDGNALDLGGNGYPCRYTAAAKYIVPRIIEEPPEAYTIWVCGPNDILTEKWAGKTVIDQAAAAQCPSDEWLLVEAWDES